jgi:hypothetical protein
MINKVGVKVNSRAQKKAYLCNPRPDESGDSENKRIPLFIGELRETVLDIIEEPTQYESLIGRKGFLYFQLALGEGATQTNSIGIDVESEIPFVIRFTCEGNGQTI